MELWSGQANNFKQTMWPQFLTWKWCATHCHLMGCIFVKYETNLSNTQGATKQTNSCFYHPIFMKLYQIFISLNAWGIYASRSKIKVKQVVRNFVVSALRLHTYLVDLLHIWCKYNPWGEDVLWTISRYKGSRPRSHGLFEFLPYHLLEYGS